MKKSTVFTIFKKELTRFLKDRRMVVALLLPGILIYLIYSLMGGAFDDMFGADEDYLPTVAVVALPDSIGSMEFDTLFAITEIGEQQAEEYKELVASEAYDLLVCFPADFDESVAVYNSQSGTAAPSVEIYYNSASATSPGAYSVFVSLLDAYESSMTNKFDVNMGGGAYDLASEENLTAMIFSMMMPMLLIMLLFAGCMSVAPESIAGEKERGTIATLLITPAKRSHIAIGKILALSVLALISGASSTIGTVLSLPKLMNMGDEMTLSADIYGVYEYLMLALVILSTVLLLVTLVSIVSAFAKSIKEASGYISPLMILSMVIGMSGMFGGATQSISLYAIPVYNSVQCMLGIFSFDVDPLFIAVTAVCNIVYTAFGVFVLTRMFNSERIMFNK